jgi:manganese transport protein
VRFVSNRETMGALAIGRATALLAWLVAAVIVVLNLKLLADTLMS